MSDMSMLLSASMHTEEAIDLFKVWVSTRVRYTGICKNANKMSKILPLFQGFVRDRAEFFQTNFGYTWRGKKPGQLSPIYPLFRDHICLEGLTHIRNEMAAKFHVNPCEMRPLRYIMKHTQRSDGQHTPRAICEWVDC